SAQTTSPEALWQAPSARRHDRYERQVRRAAASRCLPPWMDWILATTTCVPRRMTPHPTAATAERARVEPLQGSGPRMASPEGIERQRSQAAGPRAKVWREKADAPIAASSCTGSCLVI